ncbi:MAG: asparaginase [Candidatus Riflebacteria bacterium]|nr:asparaginase [Candidatus Riflebacteria bacterium]
MPSATPDLNARPLVLAYRGPVLENVCFGHAVALDAHGKRVFHLGNTARLTPVRSCLKPFQALPSLLDELPAPMRPTDADLALMCGSHAAERDHLEGVRSLLSRAGASEGDLGCGCPPERPSRLYHGCSGKHAGMLLYCRAMGLPQGSYLEPSHPLQERILTEVLRLSRSVRPEVPVLIDGCGAPIVALSLEKLAWLYAQLARPTGLPAELSAALMRVAQAMRTHPRSVGGSSSFDSHLIEATRGRIVAKCGADGLQCLADRESGVGIAVKCETPSIPLAQAAALALARKLGTLSAAEYDALAPETLPPRLNSQGREIGRLRLAAELV